MEEINKCADTLRHLIADGSTNGILLAEKAIDELLSGTPSVQHQTALASVQALVKSHRAAASGSQLAFADTVNDYIERVMRRFE